MAYKDSQSFFEAIEECFQNSAHVEFYGSYNLPRDPLVSDNERVKMAIHEIWKVTGYRFM